MLESSLNDALSLLQRTNKGESVEEKLSMLNEDRHVCKLRKKQPQLWEYLLSLPKQDQYLLLISVALRQGRLLFKNYENSKESEEKIGEMLLHLHEIESFYHEMGGIIGYHLSFLQQLKSKLDLSNLPEQQFSQPFLWDLTKNREIADEWALLGLKALDKTAALFPMGGSGDRLGLIDSETKESLPAAMLTFMGRPLVEHLIREVIGLEHAYYRTFGEKITIPIAIMTSEAKQNHDRIVQFFQKKNWFSRPKESFFLFQQMSVPLITEDGDWGISSPLTMDVRPGGHGVIWELMREHGVFDWLMEEHKKEWAFLRQINNPVGGIDLGYLPMLGIGSSQKKKMGFASCQRKVGSPEGMNAFCQLHKGDVFEQGISNIEYTDFEKYNIKDISESGSDYSLFPSNTNILFVNLQAVKEALQKEPYPGLMINMKNTTNALNDSKQLVEKKAGRLELMMQNIADSLRDISEKPMNTVNEQQKLSTFVTYNERRKTISVTKKLYNPKESIEGTPQGALRDYLCNCRELLTEYCNVSLPEEKTVEDYLENGPAFLFSYHPALGPLFTDLAKVIQNGSLSAGSEVDLNIKEVCWQDVTIDGSLLIETEDEAGSFCKVSMKKVKIENAGIDYSAKDKNIFWKGNVKRKEKCQIFLQRNAQLIMENVILTGDQMIVVPANTTLMASTKDGKLVFAKKEG